jgi:hypothetical protein
MAHDVKSIKDVNDVGGSLGYGVNKWLPHVGADGLQIFCTFLAKPVKEFLESILLSLIANPQQSATILIDLVNQRCIDVPFFSGELIDANVFDTIESAVL